MAIITISRGTFSGGEALAVRLGEQLGYRVLSREVLAEAAVQYGVSEAELAEAMGTGPGLWDRFLHGRRLYLAFVQATLCDQAAGNKIVYHGHAGHLLLRGVRHVLRVRLIAPLGYRIDQVQSRKGLTSDDAAAYIARVDRERERWTRFLYGVDWNDSSLYDLVLNLEHLDTEAACSAVVATISHPQFQPDAESLRAFADLHLASRVRAVLAAGTDTALADVEVRAAAGVVEVEGKLIDPRLVEIVVEKARTVSGVTDVRYGTRVMLRGSRA
ncbi:MAG: cytidylate kinase family protein [Polyangiaceae bacterium]|nr:cytidylate kinase family protein [Polyangiaceae bacterium]